MRPVALLLPDATSHTRLSLQPGALDILRNMRGRVSIISVVGAYRTGKSWLLNELMHLGCGEGFVVGHERHTQTKGVWILPAEENSTDTTRIFMDTEGFEGTGQAEVYDDRIFAFAALSSDVLVYNLAETIKQADIERLAFAAQLSHEFWRRANPAEVLASSASRGEWTPPALLWLVQRDFLQGGSVEAYLQQALKPTSEERKVDEHSRRLDQVREALNSCFGRMRAMGLVQPHVKRTQLCSLPRSSFEPDYLKGAAEVSAFVTQHSSIAATASATPSAGGATSGSGGRRGLDGRTFATLVERVVEALNAHEIPTAGSVVDAFNARLVQGALSSIRDGLRQLRLICILVPSSAYFRTRKR